jgi:hypothetical protein
MEEYLRDIEAWCWRYKENTRNYPGLHFTATAKACDAICKCLTQLRREPPPAHRTIPLKMLNPSDEQKVSGGQAFDSFPRLRISLQNQSDKLSQMSFRVQDARVYFDFTERWLSEFEQGLANVKRGVGDYSIEPDENKCDGKPLGQLDRKSECLWFWPCFGHLRVAD